MAYPQWGVVQGSPGQHVTKVANAAAKILMEAVAFPSRVLFFPTQKAAEDWVAAHGGQHFVPGTQAPLNAANAGINAATGAVAGVPDFLARLSNAHTWLRVAEAVVGIAFLIIGLNHVLGNPAGKAAGVAAKAAVLLWPHQPGSC